jgi:hypothetical protein
MYVFPITVSLKVQGMHLRAKWQCYYTGKKLYVAMLAAGAVLFLATVILQ